MSIFDHTQLKIYKPPFTFIESIFASLKAMLIDQFLREIKLIEEFYNLIGWEHFWPHAT